MSYKKIDINEIVLNPFKSKPKSIPPTPGIKMLLLYIFVPNDIQENLWITVIILV